MIDETLGGAELPAVFRNALERARRAFDAGERGEAKKIIDGLSTQHGINIEVIIQLAAGDDLELYDTYISMIDDLDNEINSAAAAPIEEGDAIEEREDASHPKTWTYDQFREESDSILLGLKETPVFEEYRELASGFLSANKSGWTQEQIGEIRQLLMQIKNLSEALRPEASPEIEAADFEIPQEALDLSDFVSKVQPEITQMLSILSVGYDPNNSSHQSQIDDRVKTISAQLKSMIGVAQVALADFEVLDSDPFMNKKKRIFVEGVRTSNIDSPAVKKLLNDIDEVEYQVWLKRLDVDNPLFTSISGYLASNLSLNAASIVPSVTAGKNRLDSAEQWDTDAQKLLDKLSGRQRIHVESIINQLHSKINTEKQGLFDFWKANLGSIYDELDAGKTGSLANLLLTIPGQMGTADRKQLKSWHKEVSDHLNLAKSQVDSTSDQLILKNDARYQQELGITWKAAEKLLSDLNNSANSETTEKELIVDSILSFFDQRGVPRRESKPEYQNFDTYIEAVTAALWKVAAQTQLNAIYDAKAAARTANYVLQPMAGPAHDFDLVNETLLYEKRETRRITNFSALFDLFHNLFDDPNEQSNAMEYAQNLKEKFMQMTVWHKRALTRRSNEDATGPNGLFKFTEAVYNDESMGPDIRQLYTNRENSTDFEKRITEAMRYSSAVWSAMSLKSHERRRLWHLMDPRVQDFFVKNPPAGVTSPNYPKIKGEFDLVPRYRSTERNRLAMIRKMLLDIEQILDPSVIPLQTQNPALESYDDKKERSRQTYVIAELIYAQSENFRIGSGIEDFLDVSYKNDNRNPNVSNITVQAQEGGPKAANLGLYVEGAWGNQARPDFIEPFRRMLAHGFLPYLRAAQFTLASPPPAMDHWGDRRASLAEIMSVAGALDNVQWGTRSTNPDKVVYQSANQATNFLWPISQMGQAIKPENRFFIDVLQPPLESNALLSEDADRFEIMSMLGWFNKKRELGVFQRGIRRFRQSHSIPEVETLGFEAESTPLSNTERIKKMFKDQRDYWLDAFTPDREAYPRDVMRNLAFIFSRNDTGDGYVNEKIAEKFEDIRTNKRSLVGSTSDGGWFMNEVYQWLRGYVTYDLLMQSTFYMLSPNLEGISGLVPGSDFKKVYDKLSVDNYDSFIARTRAGSIGSDERLRIPLNGIQLEWLIYQAMLLLKIIPVDPASGLTETQAIINSGYKLFDGTGGTRTTANGKVFDHADLLALAQSFGMGDGYQIVEEKADDDRLYKRLRRIPGAKPTVQFVFDRLTLLVHLFAPKKLAYSK